MATRTVCGIPPSRVESPGLSDWSAGRCHSRRSTLYYTVVLKKMLLGLWHVVAGAGVVLGVSGWPVNVETWFEWARGVPGQTWRWIFAGAGFVMMAASFVKLVVIPSMEKARRARRAEQRYVDFAHATYIVAEYLQVRYAEARVSISATQSLVRAFEKKCPEAKRNDGGYDGYLLHAWIRYNAAQLLRNTSSLKPLPPEVVEKIGNIGK